jgi:hypothetical protein
LKLKSKIKNQKSKIKIYILKKTLIRKSDELPKIFGNPFGKIVLMTKTKIKSHKQSSNKRSSFMHIEKCVQTDESEQALMREQQQQQLFVIVVVVGYLTTVTESQEEKYWVLTSWGLVSSTAAAAARDKIAH